MRQDPVDSRAGAQIVGQIVPELTELIEDDVVRILVELGAFVVDLFDVALGAVGPDDVFRVRDPCLEPIEALSAHTLGQHRDPPTVHDPRDRDAPSAVVAGGGPDRPMMCRVELPGDDPGSQATVGGEHLVSVDHREMIRRQHDDLRFDACQGGRQDDVIWDSLKRAASRRVVPVDAEQIQGMGSIGLDLGESLADGSGNSMRFGQLAKGRQADARLPKMGDGVFEDGLVDDLRFQPECRHDTVPPARRSSCDPTGAWPAPPREHGSLPGRQSSNSRLEPRLDRPPRHGGLGRCRGQ